MSRRQLLCAAFQTLLVITLHHWAEKHLPPEDMALIRPVAVKTLLAIGKDCAKRPKEEDKD